MAKLSPRVKLATRLYASGAVETKGAAAVAAGLAPSYFYIASTKNPQVQELVDEIDQQIHDKTVTLSAVIESISREALVKMRALMLDSNNEAIQYKAASDLLDRNPETSKTQKHQLSSFSLSGDDAKSLARALVKSAEARQLYAQGMEGDFVRIAMQDEDRVPELQGVKDAGQRLLTPEVRQVHEVFEAGAERRGDSSQGTTEDVHSSSAEGGAAAQEHEAESQVVDITPAGKQLRLL